MTNIFTLNALLSIVAGSKTLFVCYLFHFEFECNHTQMAHTLSAHTWRRCANDAATPSKGGRAGVLCTTSINTRWLARKVCVCLCVGTDFKLAEQLSDPQKGVCVSSESLLKVCAYILHSHSHKCVMLTRTRTQMSVTF